MEGKKTHQDKGPDFVFPHFTFRVNSTSIAASTPITGLSPAIRIHAPRGHRTFCSTKFSNMMNKHSCSALWLSLSPRGNEMDLLASNRLQTVMDYIPDPNTQSASSFLFIGNKSKKTALRELFSIKKTRRHASKRGPTDIDLHIDSSSIFQNPLLIFEGNLMNKNELRYSPAVYLDMKRQTIYRSGEMEAEELQSKIYGHLLSPFLDVCIFFCDDLGGLNDVAKYLAKWVDYKTPSTLPADTRPMVIVVAESIEPGSDSEDRAQSEFRTLIHQMTNRDIAEQFSGIEVVALLPRGAVSENSRFRPLKDRLMYCSNTIRGKRQSSQVLFSVTHFTAFLEKACEHFCSNLGNEEIDFIRLSRAYNPVATDLEKYLCEFLGHVKSPSSLLNFAAPVIASSFFIDSHPPGAHYFSPKQVFGLYKPSLIKAVRHHELAGNTFCYPGTQSAFLEKVEVCFVLFIKRSVDESKHSKDIHFENLGRFRDLWKQVISDSVCFACLRRNAPATHLPCGHMVCNNCVRIFADCPPGEPNVFVIRTCVLCQATLRNGVNIRTHPPTAGVGVLCIDGGGVRGIMPLQIMKRIQECVALPIDFQEFIKVAFGISSGGLIVADVFLNGSSIEQSSTRFENMARRIFRRRKTPLLRHLQWLSSMFPMLSRPIQLTTRLIDVLLSYFADGIYPRHNIESALQAVFGQKGILNISKATATGTLVGLPVATTSNRPTCRVFTNNGPASEARTKCNIVSPAKGLKNVPLWKIARASSAALGFFPPIHIPGIGTFQDSGPIENDPIKSALDSVPTFFPSAENLDYILSFGTGRPQRESEFTAADLRNIWKNGPFQRLFHVILERTRDKDLKRAYESHPGYQRLDFEFVGSEPRLDDVESIAELKHKAQNDEVLTPKIEKVARRLISCLFYFELDSLPRLFHGKYQVTGTILCVIKHTHPAFTILFDRLLNNSAMFWINGVPAMNITQEAFTYTRDFKQKVELNVESEFDICLQQNIAGPCNISGSPFSLERLISQQGLRAVFGHADQRKRKCSRGNFQKRKKHRHL